MRRFRNFDNRFYGFLIGRPDSEIRKRRRQFVESFPILIPFIYKETQHSTPLIRAVDQGILLLQSEGLHAIIGVLNQKFQTQFLPRAARAYATVKGRQLTKTYREAIDAAMPLLARIEPANWPKTEMGHLAAKAIYGALVTDYPKTAARLSRDTGPHWDDLAKSVERAIKQRFQATRDMEQYEAERRALAAGLEYKASDNLPEVTVQKTDVANTVARIIDYLNMVMYKGLLPQLYRENKEIPDFLTKGFNNNKEFRDRLFASASFRQLVEASEIWHEPRRIRRLNARISELDPELASLISTAWLPIIPHVVIPPETHIGGLQFIELTTPEELKEEGAAMRHCVWSYSRDCQRPGGSHIISLRNATGNRLSTIHLNETGETGKEAEIVRLMANLTYMDRQPSSEALAAGKWLVSSLNDKTIEQTSTFPEREARRIILSSNETSKLIRLAADPGKAQMAFDLYREHFPSGWKKFRTARELVDFVDGRSFEPRQQNRLAVLSKLGVTEYRATL
jgi:hypothetical protein